MPKVEINLDGLERKEYKTANGNTFKTVSMGTDIMFIDTPEGYDNLTEKSREILQLLYLQKMEHFDWFLKADDDTYVIMENMRFLLKGLNPETPAYLGKCRLLPGITSHNGTVVSSVYFSFAILIYLWYKNEIKMRHNT